MIDIHTDKMIFIGDLHYGVHVNSLEWLDHQKRFVYDFLIPQLKSLAERGIKYSIWQFGDVFEQKQSLNVNIFDSVISIFDDLLPYCYDFNIFLGNHDTYYIDDNVVNTPKILSRIHKTINVYNKPTQIRVNDKNTYLILPWFKDSEYLRETILNDNSDYLMAHMDINEFRYPSGVKVKDNIDPKILQKYKKVYSGHIHIRQEKDNVLYIGTPYQMEYSDINNTKGIYIVDATTNEVEFIENKITPSYNELDFIDFIELPLSTIKDIFKGKSYLYLNIDYSLYKSIDVVSLMKRLLQDVDGIISIKFNKFNEEDSLEKLDNNFKSVDIFEISKMILSTKDVSDKTSSNTLQLLNELFEESKYHFKNNE